MEFAHLHKISAFSRNSAELGTGHLFSHLKPSLQSFLTKPSLFLNLLTNSATSKTPLQQKNIATTDWHKCLARLV